MQSSLRYGFGIAVIGFAMVLAGACAKGDSLDGSENDGDGGAGGSGRTSGNGATKSSTKTGLNGSSTTGAVTNGPGATTATTNPSTTTNGPTTTTTNNTVNTVTTGGAVDCDPENPGPGCGSSQHCVPQVAGDPVCEAAGAGVDYQLCPGGRGECAPVYECVFDGVDACCMRWCQVAADNCGGFETCTGFGNPVFVDGVEYGACWDGLPCVI